jgi:nitrite reductase/ring-hydroxylating ferredoxin subunit
MVNHNAFTAFPEDYVAVGAAADFTEGVMRKVDAGGTAVLVVRLDGRLHAIADVCSHAGGPLDEGELAGDVVTCPWHGSKFCVRDGRVRGGPATFNQPVFALREVSGRVELKAAQATH